MDLNPSQPDSFRPALLDASVNSSQHGAWQCTYHNKKIRATMNKRGKRPTFHPENWDMKWARVEFCKSFHTLPTLCYCFCICLSNCVYISFIPDSLPCSADDRMDCRLQSSCLLCLHFCLGTWRHLWRLWNSCIYIYQCMSNIVCPSNLKMCLYMPKRMNGWKKTLMKYLNVLLPWWWVHHFDQYLTIE